MKKILSIILLNILMISNVAAKDNKLVLTEEGNRIYYNSSKLDKDVFLNHQDMTPGTEYEDILIIENDSSTDYKLYFKVKERTQSEIAQEILENIEMEIYLDENLVYNGKAKGLDYDNSGVNLQNAILLGEFKAEVSKKMKVVTKLNEEYENQKGNNLSYIDWEFYASYNNEINVIEQNPNTGDFQLIKLVTILISIFIILVTLIYLLKKIEKRKLKIKLS